MEKDFHVDCYVCEVSIAIHFFSIGLVLSKAKEKWKSMIPANQIMEILHTNDFLFIIICFKHFKLI